MTDPEPEKNNGNACDSPQPAGGSDQDAPVNMTLENIVDMTGEMEHLNELVVLSVERAGGFTCNDAYFATVQPILDLLEVEIRVRFQPGMSRNQMKLIIQDWIDGEIRGLRQDGSGMPGDSGKDPFSPSSEG